MHLRYVSQSLILRIRHLCTTASRAQLEKSVKFIETEREDRHPLDDTFGRRHTYLRISLTELCNLRCTYCMPEEGISLTPSSKILTCDEIVRLTKIFAVHGVNKVRLTGGEPTLRKDIIEIIGRIAKIDGIQSIGITTNGITLRRKLTALVAAGLTRVNISLDTLNDAKYMIMTRRNGLNKVLESIRCAEELFDEVKINTVVIRQVNSNEIIDFVRLTEKRNLNIRFIEYMPFGGNRFESKKMVSYKEMLNVIDGNFANVVKLKDSPNDTAKAYQVVGFRGKFGFISSMTNNFCSTCNRIRITADGNFKVCLHDNAEVSLRDLMRNGSSDNDLFKCIREAICQKKQQHAGLRILSHSRNRPMILIGG
ncbi:hypothetical protein AB6A40_005563 [Gnathostoma spinigerum]|uniref:GTP 3',8-cyclase n=1 Tax=Gnathostoma spinigerum TaxID=75299 RepID=A0ABD6EFS4_9BILA